ncbi:MAG: methyl-accepting chemotaxis protein, partial [Thermotogota bacterium]
VITSICLLLILALFSFSQIKNTVSRLMNTNSYEIAQGSANQISEWVLKNIATMQVISTFNVAANMEKDRLPEVLSRIIKNTDAEFETLFVADKNGVSISNTAMEFDLRQRDYFQAIMTDGKEFYVSNPLISNESQQPAVVVCSKISNNKGETIGLVGGVIPLDDVSEIVTKASIAGLGYGFIIDGTGLIIAHPNKSYVMKSNVLDSDQNGYEGLTKVGKKMINGETGNGIGTTPEGNKEIFFFTTIPNTPDWSLGIAVDLSELNADTNRLLLFIIILVIVIALVFVVLSYFLGRIISKPIQQLALNVEKFGKGDLTTEFEIQAEDEIGQMANHLEEMGRRIRESMIEITKATNNVNTSADDIAAMAEEGSATAEELFSQSESVDSNVQNTSASIEEVTSGVQEVAASAQEISKNSQELANDINETEKAVKSGQAELQKQGERMQVVGQQSKTATQLVTTVAEKANNVQEIVNAISSIAEQTNLLALNAAIEAARAGEAGKGFAVVADEIRKLAEESQGASSNIAKILHEIDEGSDKANTAVKKTVELYDELNKGSQILVDEFNKITGYMENINNRVESLSGAAQEQSASAEEMASAMDTSAKSMASMSEQMEEITNGIKQTADSAQKMSDTAEELTRLSETLEKLVKKFKI